MNSKQTSVNHHFITYRSMKLQRPNTPKSLQIYSVYPIYPPAGQLVSNPDWTTLERPGQKYCLSTSRFQKPDMMPVAVTSTSFLGVELAVVFS